MLHSARSWWDPWSKLGTSRWMWVLWAWLAPCRIHWRVTSRKARSVVLLMTNKDCSIFYSKFRDTGVFGWMDPVWLVILTHGNLDWAIAILWVQDLLLGLVRSTHNNGLVFDIGEVWSCMQWCMWGDLALVLFGEVGFSYRRLAWLCTMTIRATRLFPRIWYFMWGQSILRFSITLTDRSKWDSCDRLPDRVWCNRFLY